MVIKMMLIFKKTKIISFLIEKMIIKNKKMYKDMIIVKIKVVLCKIINLNKK